MDRAFVKRDPFRRASLVGEAAALRWLGEAEASGGLRVAHVISVTEDELVEERVSACRPTHEAAERIGRALARTHAAGAGWWGAPPLGWSGPYRIDDSLTPTVGEADAPATWGAFYAEHRIMGYVRALVDRGELSAVAVEPFERVASRLCSGDFDVPQPGLIRALGREVARLHGDLWAGNLLWDANPANPTGGVLIDPMAHGGHAETDLAMLALFGCPYLDVIIDGYNEVSSLAEGWQERVGLHQLSPVLLHCVLYGGWYVQEALSIARRYA